MKLKTSRQNKIKKNIKKTPVRLNLIQEVKREKEILVTAEVELAVVDSNGSISKLPKDLLEKI
jgi:acyl-CoA thioesterase FadM